MMCGDYTAIKMARQWPTDLGIKRSRIRECDAANTHDFITKEDKVIKLIFHFN